MREINILKDGILPRLPKITKYIRNVLYVILALSLIAAAILKRADYLDPSTMVTNIAVIAMVSYPVAAIFAIFAKLLLTIFTSDEFNITSRRVFGFAMFGKPCEIAISDISEVTSHSFILKAVKITDTNGKSHLFIGLRSAERIAQLIDHLRVGAKTLAQGEGTDSESHALNTAALLKEYEQLRSKNLITGSEYENIKKQIIGL